MNRFGILFDSLPLPLALRFAVVYSMKRMLDRDASLNYSQTGEDAVIRSLLDETRPGLDVELHRVDRNPVTRRLAAREFRQIGYDTLDGYIADARSPRPGLRLP